MSEKTFKIKWAVDEGTTTISKMHSFDVSAEDIIEKNDYWWGVLTDVLHELVNDQFDEKITYECLNRQEFIDWAKGIVKEQT